MMIRSVVVCLLCSTICGTCIASLEAQATPAQAPAHSLILTLGDAIRFAAHNSTAVQGAQYRAIQADARVHQARSALLPTINALGTDGVRTFNSTSLGFTFPSVSGQPPLFNPTGQVIGPVRNIDYRGRITQSLFDPSALGRLRSAQILAQASTTDMTTAADQAGTIAALAYIRILRAEEECRIRSADSVLAADLVSIAQHQQQAGAGITVDVTRAQTQLASTRAQLIASRNSRDRARPFPIDRKHWRRDSEGVCAHRNTAATHLSNEKRARRFERVKS